MANRDWAKWYSITYRPGQALLGNITQHVPPNRLSLSLSLSLQTSQRQSIQMRIPPNDTMERDQKKMEQRYQPKRLYRPMHTRPRIRY